MAGDWIKLEHVTPDKPEVARISMRLGIDPDCVVGKLCRIWIWADQQSVAGNGISVTDSFIDRITFCEGFAAALRFVGWLSGDADSLQIPNFERHNGKTAKARAVTNRRVSNHRAQCNGATVTNVTESALEKPLPEKRREEVEKERSARAAPCTIAQAKSAASGTLGVSAALAEEWWHDRNSKNWEKSDHSQRVIRIGNNWQSDLKAWATSVDAGRNKSNYPPNGQNQRPGQPRRPDRNAGTDNDPSEFAGR